MRELFGSALVAQRLVAVAQRLVSKLLLALEIDDEHFAVHERASAFTRCLLAVLLGYHPVPGGQNTLLGRLRALP